MQAPLKLANNKYKAASAIAELFPKKLGLVHSLFFTNGGLEISLSKHYNAVVGYTTFASMQMFWDCLCEDPAVLAAHVEKIIASRWFDDETFYDMQKGFETYQGLYTRAAIMFVLSHLSDSGEIFSGRYIYGNPKIHISDYTLMKLKKFEARNLTVAYIDTDDPLNIIDNISEDEHIVCAPPDFSYNLLKNSKIAIPSDINLNHEELFNVLKNRKKWVLIYKMNAKITSMYSDYDIIYLDKYWRPTELVKNASEVIIHNV